MYKILAITLCLTLGMSVSTSAQFNLSVSSGVNYSNSVFKNWIVDAEPRLGYFIGIAPGYQINERMRVLVDLQYSTKGHKVDVKDDLTPSEFRYSYFDIMPELEYDVLNFLSLGIGMNYGIKLKEEYKHRGDWSDSYFFYDGIRPTDFGLTGKVKVSHKNMFGFVRYNMGLMNITELTVTDANGQVIDNFKQFNRNVQIGIGYTFK